MEKQGSKVFTMVLLLFLLIRWWCRILVFIHVEIIRYFCWLRFCVLCDVFCARFPGTASSALKPPAYCVYWMATKMEHSESQGEEDRDHSEDC
ncbi:hypothetical protein F5146DRAFT_690727 [Armillaria mellea]|nr:hypothetical protein F5146DRAFT_690727 [Armillaria mellea]